MNFVIYKNFVTIKRLATWTAQKEDNWGQNACPNFKCLNKKAVIFSAKMFEHLSPVALIHHMLRETL